MVAGKRHDKRRVIQLKATHGIATSALSKLPLRLSLNEVKADSRSLEFG